MELAELALDKVLICQLRVLVAVQLHRDSEPTDKGDVYSCRDDAIPHITLPLKHVQPLKRQLRDKCDISWPPCLACIQLLLNDEARK